MAMESARSVFLFFIKSSFLEDDGSLMSLLSDGYWVRRKDRRRRGEEETAGRWERMSVVLPMVRLRWQLAR